MAHDGEIKAIPATQAIDDSKLIESIRTICNGPQVTQFSDQKKFNDLGFSYMTPHYATGFYTKLFRALKDQENIVLKTMDLTQLKPERKKQFLEESCKIFEHVAKKEVVPNVVRVFGLFLVEPSLYVFMQHYAERSIHYKMRVVAQFKEPLVQRWTKQLASVCKYLHEKGIVHRSIRVEHLLLDEHENIHLTGWTRAIFLLNPTTSEQSQCHRESQIHKFNHLPPECFLGTSHSPALIDHWSFGVMIVALSTNRHAFKPNKQTMTNFEQQWKQFVLKHGSMLNPQVTPTLNRLFLMQQSDRISLDDMLKVEYLVGQSEANSVSSVNQEKPQTGTNGTFATSYPPVASKNVSMKKSQMPKFQAISLKPSSAKSTKSSSGKSSPKSSPMASKKGSKPNSVPMKSSGSDSENKKTNISVKPSTLANKSKSTSNPTGKSNIEKNSTQAGSGFAPVVVTNKPTTQPTFQPSAKPNGASTDAANRKESKSEKTNNKAKQSSGTNNGSASKGK